MKKAKKALALLLAVVMCVSLVSAIAYAKDDGKFVYEEMGKTVNYDIVCIGDSTSIGYGLEDFGVDHNDPKWTDEHNGLGDNNFACGIYDFSSKSAFPYLIGEYAQKALGAGYVVSSTNLGMEGMRFQELRSILDPTFKGDAFNKHHMGQYNAIFDKNITPKTGLNICQTYRKAIGNAEVVVLDSLTNSFGTYLGMRLTGKGYNETYADILDEMVPGTAAAVDSIVSNMITKLGLDIEDPQVKDIADGIVYAYLEMCVNFDACIEMIRQINPLAKIIVVGAYNTMDGLYAKVGDLDVDFGGLWNTLMSLVNNYVTLLSSNRNQYFYADVSDGIHMFWQGLAECTSIDEIAPMYAEYLYGDTMGMILGGMGMNMAQLEEAQASYAQLMAKTMDPEGKMTNYEMMLCVIDLAGQESTDPSMTNLEYWTANEATDALTRYYTAKATLDKVNAAGGIEMLELAAGLTEENVLKCYIEAAQYKTLDLEATFAAMADIPAMGIAKALSTGTLKDAEPGVAELLHIMAHFQLAYGVGAHPDEIGCYQKFEAVRDAWLKVKTADKDDNNSVAGFWHNFGSSILNTFQAPLLDKINQIINNFIDSFIAFWTNLFGAVKQ